MEYHLLFCLVSTDKINLRHFCYRREKYISAGLLIQAIDGKPPTAQEEKILADGFNWSDTNAAGTSDLERLLRARNHVLAERAESEKYGKNGSGVSMSGKHLEQLSGAKLSAQQVLQLCDSSLTLNFGISAVSLGFNPDRLVSSLAGG